MDKEQRAALRALAAKVKANAPDWYTPHVLASFAEKNGGFPDDAPFMLAANPAAILSLLDALAAAEAENARPRETAHERRCASCTPKKVKKRGRE